MTPEGTLAELMKQRGESERGRAYRALLEAGFTRWPEHGSAPDWAAFLSYLQHRGAQHFYTLDWARIWRHAAEDPAWADAFEAVVAHEHAYEDALGLAGSRYQAGVRIAAWLRKTTMQEGGTP